jgi:signal transduction histidine kinase
MTARPDARTALDRALAEAELLNGIARAASVEPELDGLLAAALERIGRLVPFTGASVWLVEGDDLVIRAANGPFAGQAVGQRLPRGRGATWRVVESGESFLAGDLLAEGLRPTTRLRSYLAVPLGWRGHRFGVLEVDSTEAFAFDAADLRLMESAAAALSGSIELAARYAAEVRYAAELQVALAERDHALAEIRELERAREAFLSAASHDLRTPLTTIRALAQLAERAVRRIDDPAAGKVIEWLGTITQASTRMGKLIAELLDVARLHAGRPLELRREEVDLVALARRVSAEQVTTTGLDTIRFEPAVESLVGRWDPDRVERVLGNLLSNAIKYSPDGSAILVRVAARGRGRARRAVLAVTDHGLGIPADELPKVFQRYHRASNVAGRVGGTGMGLASVQQIVAQHGGTVAVESVEGEGSTFTVELPLAPPPDEGPPGPAA